MVIITLYALLLIGGLTANAQTEARLWQVFLQRGDDGTDTLTFIDALTGGETSINVRGSRYTLTGRFVMFLDGADNRVKLASPDGRVREHPFVQPAETSLRVDWAVSGNGQLVAWTQTSSADNSLITDTWIASSTGANPTPLLVDGPRLGVRAVPVAFSADNAVLYMDYQPNAIADLFPLRQYAGLFGIDAASSALINLPGEPGCYCGAGFGAGLLLRLVLNFNATGYDLVVHDLARETTATIDAVDLPGYTQGGDILISADGSHAAYVLSQVNDFATPEQVIRSEVVLVDLRALTQTALDRPLNTFIRPIEWTENNSAVIFSATDGTGTWKANFSGQSFDRIARASYLGEVSAG